MVDIVLVAKSCPPLAITSTVVHQALLSMGFLRQEYWSVLPFASPGDLSDLGIESMSRPLQMDYLPLEPPGVCCLSIEASSFAWTFWFLRSLFPLVFPSPIMVMVSYSN